MQNTQSSLEPYITSAFSKHALLATTSVMSSIIGGVSKLTIAKIIDIWGRVEGFALVVGLLVIGMLDPICSTVYALPNRQTRNAYESTMSKCPDIRRCSRLLLGRSYWSGIYYGCLHCRYDFPSQSRYHVRAQLHPDACYHFRWPCNCSRVSLPLKFPLGLWMLLHHPPSCRRSHRHQLLSDPS